MPTACFAVQPASFANFDEWGCDWATDINHAYRLAATYEKMQSSGAARTVVATPSAGFVLSTKATASKRAKIAKAGARLLNRFLPHHKIVVFTK